VETGRLANGLPWTIPVTLSVGKDPSVGAGAEVALRDPDGTLRAVMEVSHVWKPNKEREAERVYGTTERKHPGWTHLFERADQYLGGKIWLFAERPAAFPQHHHEPKQTRAYFREKGWKRIAAFQTRNPIHRAHEYLTKAALEIADGILIHPLV